MTRTVKVRKSSVKQSTEVKYSDRGYAYADLGLSKTTGIIPFVTSLTRPNLKDTPTGVPIFNLDTYCLEISDPENNTWISICPGALSGNALSLGIPTDGTYIDGALGLNPSGTISDAIDAINEYLLLLSSGTFTYASHLGTTDGTTNGILFNPVFSIGRVSSPTSSGNPYYTNNWDNNTNRDITRDNILLWELNSGQRITDLQSGTISGIFYNGNGLLHTESLILDGTNNNQSSTPSGYINISTIIPVGSKKEGFLSFSIPTTSLLNNNSGYLKAEISHTTTSGIFSNNPIEFFKDSAGAPSILLQQVTYSGGPTKYLSGIKFATISGISRPQLQFTLSGNNIWSDTYRSDPLLVNSSQFGIPNYIVNYNSSSITKDGISPPISPFNYNDDFGYSELKDITSTTIINPDSSGNYKQVFYTVRDPFNTVVGSSFEPIPRILINTYPQQSADNVEFFLDEDYRLKPSSSGTGIMTSISGIGRGIDAFNSTESLLINPSLQVINGRLIYPKNNFSTTTPSINPDYTTLSSGVGNLTYIRRFRNPNGSSHSNGIFKIIGLSESDRAAGNIFEL
jgi:hypothetical protein